MEERREQRELEYRALAEKREEKMMLALKENQDRTHRIDLGSSRLPEMKAGEEIDVFVDFFESALVLAKIPKNKWLEKLHVALNTDAKKLVHHTMTQDDVTYEAVKGILLGHMLLTFVAASESLNGLETQNLEQLHGKQVMLKIAKILKRIGKDARNEEEIYHYMAVAVARWSFNPDFRQYLDIRGKFYLDTVTSVMGEWKASNPGVAIWDFRKRHPVGRMVVKNSQSQVRKSGECFYCGKPGHFAQQCRARLYKERQSGQESSSVGQVPRKESGVEKPAQKRDLCEVTCYTCRQKGHMSPTCPKRSNKVKRVKVNEDQILSLRKNEVFGSVGPHRMPVTCDTGAVITVVPAECVEPHQKTGELCVLRSFNDSKTTGECCVVEITVGDFKFEKEAVTQPGADLGWSVCMSLDMENSEECEFLVQQMKRRAAMSKEETLYVPPEVRDGYLVSGILVEEAQVVRVKSAKIVPQGGDGTVVEPVVNTDVCVAGETVNTSDRGLDSDRSEVPVKVNVSVQAAEAEALDSKVIVNKDEEKVGAEVVEDVLVSSREGLVKDEKDGASLGGSAEPDELKELDVSAIRAGMSRETLAEDTRSDSSLEPLLKLGDMDKEGYHVSQGLLFRTRRDSFGSTIEQLCVPLSHRQKCLVAAHSSFGHQGRNKMLSLLRPHFYWPNISRSCRDFVQQCDRCQAADKMAPKPHTMLERPVVTQPFTDVAIDLVGPFPTAVGGVQTYVDLSGYGVEVARGHPC